MKNKNKKISSSLKKLLSPKNQFIILKDFCGYLLMASFLIYSGYTVTGFVIDYFSIFSYIAPEVKVARAVEDTTIYTADMSVQEKIKFYATVYGVNKNDALRIAQCESNFNPLAENINGSATGVYQFIRKTWNKYCAGDVYNADHNIICFVQQYPNHPEWWECK